MKYNPLVKDLITLKEATEYSGLSTHVLRRHIKAGSLQAIKKGRLWLTTLVDVEEAVTVGSKPT